MINRLLNFCQNVNFELNLYELIKGLSVLVLITVLVLIVTKTVRIFQKEKKIDDHLRASRAQIARAIKEIQESNDVKMPEQEDSGSKLTQPLGELATKIIETSPHKIDTEHVIENVRQIEKGKKTRAMSMEERWAEFDKKRSFINTA